MRISLSAEALVARAEDLGRRADVTELGRTPVAATSKTTHTRLTEIGVDQHRFTQRRQKPVACASRESGVVAR